MGSELRSPRMSLPVACALDGNEASARVAEWTRLTEAALLRRERVDTGIRLTFRPDPEVAEELGRLIELEGRCCAWMSFAVKDEGDLVVDVGATDETGRRALEEIFAVPDDALS